MPIVKLEVLEPGDVLLQSGQRKIAVNTGTAIHKWGHASIMINRLLLLEATTIGKKSRIKATPLSSWKHRKGLKDPVVGMHVDGEATVFRYKKGVSEDRMILAVNEGIGLDYANGAQIARLKGLSLNPRIQQKINQSIAMSPTPKGATCGEIVASALGLWQPWSLTPNAFAESDLFEERPDVILPDSDWRQVALTPRQASIEKELIEAVEATYPETMSKIFEPGYETNPNIDAIDRQIEAESHLNILLLTDIKDMPQDLFGY